MNMKGLKDWLANINKDQFLTGLENLVNTIRNDAGRRWFPRQDIQPVIGLGRYNPLTGLYELGPEDRNASDRAESVVSAATTDFVIPNGETWEILAVTNMNQTQASYVGVFYYDGANAFPLQVNGISAGNSLNYGGGSGNPVKITGNGTIAIRTTLATFAAGNTVRAQLFYRRVR